VDVKLTRSEFVEVFDGLARQQAVGDARAGAAPGGGQEKRVGARMACEYEVLVATLNPDGTPGEAFTALTRDISFAGVALLQRMKIPQNSPIVVRLPRKDKEPLVMLCRAIHVRELADGVYAIGAEFVKETKIDVTTAANAAEIDRVRKAMMG
jgi:hypothetical protein